MSSNLAAEVPNPFGIHYLKFLVAMMIIAIHSLVFVGYFGHFEFATQNSWSMRLLAFFPSAMMVPFTAGATQALLLGARIEGSKLTHFEFGPTIKTLLLLAFIESTKASLQRAGVFFGWNVLHMLAVALVAVLMLARISVHLVWITGALAIALTPLLRAWLSPWQVRTTEQMVAMNEAGVPLLLLQILGLVVFSGTIAWLFFGSKLERQYRLRLGLLISGFFLGYLFLAPHLTVETEFAARLVNLPIGALIGDELGLHFWPLFPWYSSVAFGFCLFVWWQKTARPRAARIAVFSASLTTLIVYFTFYFGAVVANLDSTTFWNSKLFSGNLPMVAYAAASFGFFAVLCDAAAGSDYVRVQIEKHPALFRVPFVYSKTIFWAYLFVNTVGVLAAYLVSRCLPIGLAIVLFPLAMMSSWYWLGEATLTLLTRWRLKIRFSRRLSSTIVSASSATSR